MYRVFISYFGSLSKNWKVSVVGNGQQTFNARALVVEWSVNVFTVCPWKPSSTRGRCMTLFNTRGSTCHRWAWIAPQSWSHSKQVGGLLTPSVGHLWTAWGRGVAPQGRGSCVKAGGNPLKEASRSTSSSQQLGDCFPDPGNGSRRVTSNAHCVELDFITKVPALLGYETRPNCSLS